MEEENEKQEKNEITNNDEKENIVIEVEKNTENKELEETKKEKDVEEEIEAAKEELNEQKKFKTVSQEIKKEKKSKKLAIILILLIVVLLLFLSTVFAIINMNNEKITDGIFIENVSIYGITQEEANKVVSDKISQIVEISVTDSNLLCHFGHRQAAVKVRMHIFFGSFHVLISLCLSLLIMKRHQQQKISHCFGLADKFFFGKDAIHQPQQFSSAGIFKNPILICLYMIFTYFHCPQSIQCHPEITPWMRL